MAKSSCICLCKKKLRTKNDIVKFLAGKLQRAWWEEESREKKITVQRGKLIPLNSERALKEVLFGGNCLAGKRRLRALDSFVLGLEYTDAICGGANGCSWSAAD